MIVGMSHELPDDENDEARDQAFSEDWARRILQCVKTACRRRKECMSPRTCPMLNVYPVSQEDLGFRLRSVRAALKRRLDEIEAGPEVAAAAAAARTAKGARRWALTLKRIEKELKEKRKASGRDGKVG